MFITHLFFDVHGVLLDRRRNPACYRSGLGGYLAERYGGSAAAWAEANRRVFEDWDSYYTDLDLGADDGIDQMWEGLFRTTRALFRLTGTPEPPHDALIQLSRTLPEQAAQRGGSALYDDVPAVLDVLLRQGRTLATASNAISGQVRGSLRAGGVLDCFSGPLFGADLAEYCIKDADYYGIITRRAGAAPKASLVIDDDVRAVQAAQQAGLHALHLARERAVSPAVDSLAALPAWLAALEQPSQP